MFLHLSVIHSQGCLPGVSASGSGEMPASGSTGVSASGHPHGHLHLPWTHTPSGHPTPWTDPRTTTRGHSLYRWPLKRVVRILLECILVSATLCVKTWIRNEFTFFYFLFIYFCSYTCRTNEQNKSPPIFGSERYKV